MKKEESVPPVHRLFRRRGENLIAGLALRKRLIRTMQDDQRFAVF